MRFRLRTLMILLAVLPPLGAGGYWLWESLRPKPPRLDLTSGNFYFLFTVEAARQQEQFMFGQPVADQPSDESPSTDNDP